MGDLKDREEVWFAASINHLSSRCVFKTFEYSLVRGRGGKKYAVYFFSAHMV